jgi:translation initiation factor 1 (eIF-1/SUI1)
MINPFSITEETNNDIFNVDSSLIEIWVEANGRKKNTYISGWNINLNEMKKHLTFIKKKNGCNGSIKNNDTLHLQGDHIEFMSKYLIDNGCDKNNIIIKG